MFIKQAVAIFDSCYKLKTKLYILIGILFLCMIMFELFECKLQGVKIDHLEIDDADDDEVNSDGDGEVGGSILCKTIRFRDFRKLCAPWKSSKKGIIIQFPAHFRKEIEKRTRKK